MKDAFDYFKLVMAAAQSNIEHFRRGGYSDECVQIQVNKKYRLESGLLMMDWPLEGEAPEELVLKALQLQGYKVGYQAALHKMPITEFLKLFGARAGDVEHIEYNNTLLTFFIGDTKYTAPGYHSDNGVIEYHFEHAEKV